MTWKERKKIENRNIVSLGGKAPKNQILPLSVARPMMKKQKEREQKMLQERLILGQLGGKLGGSSKRSAGKHKPENKGLKSSEGHFRNGILNVKHLLNLAPSRDHQTGTNMSNTWKGKGGKKRQGKKGAELRDSEQNPPSHLLAEDYYNEEHFVTFTNHQEQLDKSRETRKRKCMRSIKSKLRALVTACMCMFMMSSDACSYG
ncbi:unnamed protein product [Sphenostylis stenocarpa]|uniref:Uncharacterized protein n=1 Tax=Sphenostylis stenocarpa TaxID=92480 RepID=A0AA86SFG8_9FABA|nr:unnamed protein product [Sphenostylis stenocarpa]